MNYFIKFLTYFRIVIAPVIFLLIIPFNFFGLALFLFFLASISDYWDGFLARKYKLESIHDISEGGLAVSLLESCFNKNSLKGAMIDLNSLNFQNILQIFSETQGCYQISCKKEIAKKILGESKKK